uniref:RRM domain-containing protein n=1 Tax=Eutreptiella gymnastica TaxID=73025 RepID=A0A7S4G774_9EUGL|mmetsp:Transcript_33178/g.55545  ORF Transcript_33178/g.55545 Transcript_33178/m.55545 type:complete len:443 (+) Transcript_33178:76-1404(+)
MPPRGKGKAPPKLSTRDPALERPGTYKLLLLNCPESITTDDVLSYYRQQIGKDVVERVKWFFNRCGMFIGSGVLVFETESARKVAATLPGPVVMGRQVQVEGPKGACGHKDCELYLWDLHPSAVESDLRYYYANMGLVRVKFKMTADYSHAVGVAFVNFQSPEAAMNALTLRPPEIEGMKCRVKLSGYQGDKEVCVQGSQMLTDAVIRKHYESFGSDAILSIQWHHDQKDGHFLGRGFVCFKTTDMAFQALAWGGFRLGDEWIGVLKTDKKFSVVEKGRPTNDSWRTTEGWTTSDSEMERSPPCAASPYFLSPCMSPPLMSPCTSPGLLSPCMSPGCTSPGFLSPCTSTPTVSPRASLSHPSPYLPINFPLQGTPAEPRLHNILCPPASDGDAESLPSITTTPPSPSTPKTPPTPLPLHTHDGWRRRRSHGCERAQGQTAAA